MDSEVKAEIKDVDNSKVNLEVEKSKLDKELSNYKAEIDRLKKIENEYLSSKEKSKIDNQKELEKNNEFQKLYEANKLEYEKLKSEYDALKPNYEQLENFKKDYDAKQEKLKLQKIEELATKHNYDVEKKKILIDMNLAEFDKYLMLLPDVKTPANSPDVKTQTSLSNVDTSNMTPDEIFRHQFKLMVPPEFFG